jgi:recombination protein RecA
MPKLDKYRKLAIDLTMDRPMEGPRVISTGNWALDRLTGIGGFARGIVTEVFGAESSGKSTVILHIIRNAQQAGLRCAMLDTEGFLDQPWGKKWATSIGVDLGNLLYWYQVGPAESLLQMANEVMASGECEVFVIDSIAFLRTGSQLSAMSDSDPEAFGRVADVARILTFWAPELMKTASQYNVALIACNQMRASIDTSGHRPGGIRLGPVRKASRNEDITPGGRAWRHACYQRIFFQRIDAIMTEGQHPEPIGTVAEALLVKSKVSPPLLRTGTKAMPHIRFYFDGRLQDEAEVLVDYAIEFGVILRKGPESSWYVLPGPDGTPGTGQSLNGLGAIRNAFEENPDFATWLRSAVVAAAPEEAPSVSMYAAAGQEEASIQ